MEGGELDREARAHEISAALTRYEQFKEQRSLCSIPRFVELTDRMEEELALIARLRWLDGIEGYGRRLVESAGDAPTQDGPDAPVPTCRWPRTVAVAKRVERWANSLERRLKPSAGGKK